MKNRIFTGLFMLILFAVSFSATAQEVEKKKDKKIDKDKSGYIFINHDDDGFKTLVSKEIEHGFYASFDMGFSKVNDAEMIELGGRIGWIINHGFVLGLAGNGFINNLEDDNINDNKADVSGGYGGLLLEPIILPKSPVHLSFPVMIGAGGVSTEYWDEAIGPYGIATNVLVDDTDAFFIVRPGAELEFNVARFIRIGLGAHYRYLVDLDLEGYDSDALDGFSGVVSLKLGWF